MALLLDQVPCHCLEPLSNTLTLTLVFITFVRRKQGQCAVCCVLCCFCVRCSQVHVSCPADMPVLEALNGSKVGVGVLNSAHHNRRPGS